MRIIPAIDIIDGKCVRLSQGDYQSKKIYNEQPLEVAKAFEGAGIRYLHVVDLDGAKDKHIVNHKTLEAIASNTALSIDFGGGVKTGDDLRLAFECGARQVTVGSVAVTNPALVEEWLARYGPEQIILGADAKDGKIAASGWQEISEKPLIPFIESYRRAAGLKYAICTDISKDGMLQGAALELYAEILSKIPGLCLIASGGVTSAADLAALKETGCEGAIIGKAIYEGRLNLKDLAPFL